MPTFDVEQVRKITSGITAKLDACDHGEGNECATLDAALTQYAMSCCNFCERVREWGQAVFAGELAYDSEVNRAWQREGINLYGRACAMWSRGRRSEVKCFELQGYAILQGALWQLQYLLSNWVSPKLSVGPSPRNAIKDRDAIRKRVAELPPLPEDWQPPDQDQRAMLRKIKSS